MQLLSTVKSDIIGVSSWKGKKASYLENKSIKIIELFGKDKDWKIWSQKFLIQANYKGYRNLRTGTGKCLSENDYDLAVGEWNIDEKNYSQTMVSWLKGLVN